MSSNIKEKDFVQVWIRASLRALNRARAKGYRVVGVGDGRMLLRKDRGAPLPEPCPVIEAIEEN